VRLAQSPRFLSSPAASFRFTELLWQHLKPIMSIDIAFSLGDRQRASIQSGEVRGFLCELLNGLKKNKTIEHQLLR
jgi:hypothetical protein